MSIQPIDLQTLFVRLSQVGREQAAMKQSVDQAQDVAGREIAQHSRDVEEIVQEAEEVSDGPEKVDEEGQESERQAGHRKRKSADEAEDEPDDDVFRDPDLGQNIDLTG